MSKSYATIGTPTTGGGIVLTGNSTFLVNGVPIACVGDQATCNIHRGISKIVTGDQRMLINGKPAARANDRLSCGCRLLMNQSLVADAK